MSYFDRRGPFDLARVRVVEPSGRVHLTYPNSRVFYVERDAYEVPLSPGQVVFVDPETFELEPAPPEVWPDPEFVGAVKYRTETDTVIEVGGRLALLKTSAVKYEVNNTVLASESLGVIRVITEA